MTNGDNGSGGMGRSLTSATALLLASLLLVVLPSGSAVAQTPPDAVATAVQNAAANGVTSFVSVVDRNSGSVLAQTGNFEAAVAHYQQALAIKPDFAPASRELSRFKVVRRSARA